MNLKKILAGSVAAVVAASSFAVVANAEEGGVNYKAGLYFQTNAWTFRNSIAQSEGVWWDPDAAGVYYGYDVWQAGDVDITGDGTYMVYFEKNVMNSPSFDEDPINYCKDGPEMFWNLLGLQTNIPFDDYKTTAINEDGEEYEEMLVDITIEKLVVDGKEIAGATDATVGLGNIEIDDYADGCNGITERVGNAYSVGFYNNWNPDGTFIDGTESFGGRVMVVFTITGLGGSGGNYTEGDEPNWLTLSNDEPAGDDDTSGDTSGDDDASTTTTTEASTTSNTTGVEYSAEGDNGIIYIILGIAAAVVVIIIVIVVIVKKKK
ncbi:MAG: hypothetical protein J1F60_09870 [Oscillospiraceae bacterium]|nr:hypothetical protein [Oscillospiraceae bacterium]